MQFTLTQDFPATLQTLWGTFGDADYPLRKYHALGATALQVRRFRANAQCIEVELARDVAVQRERLPVWARALVGGRQTLTHRSVWRRTSPLRASAELDIVAATLPVRAHAVGSLVDSGHGVTRMVLSWRVDSLLGERIEKLFADQVRSALDDDHTFTLAYLQEATNPSTRRAGVEGAL